MTVKINGTSGVVGGLAIDDLSVQTLNAGQLAAFRNKIINGDMRINKRNISTITTQGYVTDRWIFSEAPTGTSTITMQQGSNGPNGQLPNTAKLTVTSAGSRDYSQLIQNIEGFNIRSLFRQTFTVSFWIRASIAGVYCAALNSGGNALFYVTECTVSSPNVWQRVSFTVNDGLPDDINFSQYGTLGMCFRIVFTNVEPTLITTTANEWVSSVKISTSNQVNMHAVNGSTCEITGVQIEVGSNATPFEHRPITIEESLCHRYYQETGEISFSGYAIAGWSNGYMVQFSEEMRVPPTISVVKSGTAGGVFANENTDSVTTRGFRYFVGNSGSGGLDVHGSRYGMDAEF